jgi:hypothetical protein
MEDLGINASCIFTAIYVNKINFIYFLKLFNLISELIRVSKEVKKKLVKLLQKSNSNGEKVSSNYAIDLLIDHYYNNKRKSSQLLISFLCSIKGLREEFEKSRREDESNNRYRTIV